MANSPQPRQRNLSQLLALGIAAYVMLWVAIFNGYPVVFDDTGEYLVDSLSLVQSPYRSVIYSIFIRLASWGMTPWLVVLAQCAITIYVLHAVFEYAVQESPEPRRERICFLGLVAFLAFATSLPWYVGQLMPDVFTGLAFLSAFLLLYDSKLSLERTILLSLILAISVGSHLSNFMSLGLLLSAVLVLRIFDRARQFWPNRSAKGIAAFVLLPILLSAGVVVSSNWYRGFGFRLSAGTPIFLLGRLIDSGLAGEYLEQQCKVEQLTPCKYLPDLPRNNFLWGSHPLLAEMGGWIGGRAEASRIVSGTIRRYPIRFLEECAKQTLREVVIFKPNDENYPIRSGYTADVMEQFYPGDSPKYRLTKQWSGRLGSVAQRLYPFYEAVFWGSLCVGFALLIRRYSRSDPANRLLILTVIFLFANALVTASVSGVHNRYQGRVSWMIGLCCAAYVIPILLNRWNPRPGI